MRRNTETLPVDCVIHTDAKSNLGADNDIIPTENHWMDEEDTHVNILELLVKDIAVGYRKNNVYKHE